MLKILLYSPAGRYLFYFEFVNASIQTMYLLLYRYLFEGCYFGAVMGCAKIICHWKYQLYSRVKMFQHFYQYMVDMKTCVFLKPFIPLCFLNDHFGDMYPTKAIFRIYLMESHLSKPFQSTAFLQIFWEFMLHSKVILKYMTASQVLKTFVK